MEPTDLRHHFLIRKQQHTTVPKKKDQRPLLWNERNAGSSPCAVCQTNQARYTCPRCSLPYCSVACFQSHNTSNTTTNSCTEAFYQQRVHQILNLEVQAKTEQTQQILTRVHEQSTPLEEGMAPCGVPEEQLYDLFVALEKDDEGKIQQLLRSNRNLRSAITRGMQQDDLHEWLLDPWRPWWMPQYYDQYLQDTTTAKEEEEEEEPELVAGKALDQYIVSLPSLKSLRTGPFVDLRFNVLQVMYAVAWTLRLYYGPTNAQEIAEQTVETLLMASSVLADNASFDSLEAVLSHCATTSTSAQSRDECNASWTELMSDLLTICPNKRFVLRCLLEAKSMVKEAAKQTENSERRMRLRRIGKKIDFFASWCNASSHRLDPLVPDIRDWVQQWSDEPFSANFPLNMNRETSKNSKKNVMIHFREKDMDSSGPLFVQEITSKKL